MICFAVCLLLAQVGARSGQPVIATNLASFEVVEEPTVRYVVASNVFVPDAFTNITDVGDSAVRMFLRYRAGDWWDADRDKDSKDRQRAEVAGLGQHQKPGDTFEYGTTWRTDPEFVAGNRFCHVFQLKALDGDDSPPLVVLSIIGGSNHLAAVRFYSGKRTSFRVAREFPWKPATWQSVKIRIKTSEKNDGEILVSVNGDDFQGVTSLPVFRPDATEYRPKWGLYRGVSKDMPFADDYVEHKNASARKM
jgi:hypothetical protein